MARAVYEMALPFDAIRDGHSLEGQWTFAASFLFPKSQDREAAPLDRAELITSLFGDQMDGYVAGEKRRWNLQVITGILISLNLISQKPLVSIQALSRRM